MIAVNAKLSELLAEAPIINPGAGRTRQQLDVESEHGPITLIAICAKCIDCHTGRMTPYMLTDAAWMTIGAPDGALCLRCAQARLGRPVTLDDFAELPVNEVVSVLRENRNSLLREGKS